MSETPEDWELVENSVLCRICRIFKGLPEVSETPMPPCKSCKSTIASIQKSFDLQMKQMRQDIAQALSSIPWRLKK